MLSYCSLIVMLVLGFPNELLLITCGTWLPGLEMERSGKIGESTEGLCESIQWLIRFVNQAMACSSPDIL